jgi:hypothetical protein
MATQSPRPTVYMIKTFLLSCKPAFVSRFLVQVKPKYIPKVISADSGDMASKIIGAVIAMIGITPGVKYCLITEKSK